MEHQEVQMRIPEKENLLPLQLTDLLMEAVA